MRYRFWHAWRHPDTGGKRGRSAQRHQRGAERGTPRQGTGHPRATPPYMGGSARWSLGSGPVWSRPGPGRQSNGTPQPPATRHGSRTKDTTARPVGLGAAGRDELEPAWVTHSTTYRFPGPNAPPPHSPLGFQTPRTQGSDGHF